MNLFNIANLFGYVTQSVISIIFQESPVKVSDITSLSGRVPVIGRNIHH